MHVPVAYGWKQMFKITGNNIEITRGDTAMIALNLTGADGNEYILKAGDIALFTVKRNTREAKCLIQKKFNDGQIKIEPSDTENLSYGDYFYDVQLQLAAGDIFTVIPPAKFSVKEEVTW